MALRCNALSKCVAPEELMLLLDDDFLLGQQMYARRAVRGGIFGRGLAFRRAEGGYTRIVVIEPEFRDGVTRQIWAILQHDAHAIVTDTRQLFAEGRVLVQRPLSEFLQAQVLLAFE